MPEYFFFQIIKLYEKMCRILVSRKAAWIQIRPQILSGLIWDQTFYKAYQQAAPAGKELQHRSFTTIYNELKDKILYLSILRVISLQARVRSLVCAFSINTKTRKHEIFHFENTVKPRKFELRFVRNTC